LTTPFTYSPQGLATRLANDDKAAFNEIYLQFWRKLYTIAFDKLKSKEAAEDVLQDVFIGLWLRRHGEIINDIEAYLATAVRYSIFRQLANERKNPKVQLHTAMELAEAHSAELRFLQQMLDEGISRLPQKCKIVFDYSRKKGLSNKEIAGELTISEKAVEKHITRAIRYLRNTFKQVLLVVIAFSPEYFVDAVG
jgi:RNA polymerase sigma-70 factor (family 1)